VELGAIELERCLYQAPGLAPLEAAGREVFVRGTDGIGRDWISDDEVAAPIGP
jgi:hypothetical protein